MADPATLLLALDNGCTWNSSSGDWTSGRVGGSAGAVGAAVGFLKEVSKLPGCCSATSVIMVLLCVVLGWRRYTSVERRSYRFYDNAKVNNNAYILTPSRITTKTVAICLPSQRYEFSLS